MFLFAVATLHNDGVAVAQNGEDVLMAAELLVPSICVSKRNRGAGTDYIAQAVSKLSYNWSDVSAAALY